MSTLVTWLIGGLVIAAVATPAARLIPSSSPAHRHTLWWLALVSVLGLPWVPSHLSSNTAALTVALTGVDAHSTLLTVPAPAEWMSLTALVVWVAIATGACARLALNILAVHRLANAARPLPAERAGRLTQFAEARAQSRVAQVCVSDDVRGACAVGFIRPRILVSSDLVAALDDEAIEAVVLHEYAHLQRRDDWTRLIQRLVLAVAGLHPAVRWISRQIDIEREAACDQMVVTRTRAPLAYARSLTSAAEIAARMSGLTPLAAPGASVAGGGLHARVSRLLVGAPARPRLAWAASAVGASGIGFATLAAAGMSPPPAIAAGNRPVPALASTPLDAGTVRELPVGARTALGQVGVAAEALPALRFRLTTDVVERAVSVGAAPLVQDTASELVAEQHGEVLPSSAGEPQGLVAAVALPLAIAPPVAGPVSASQEAGARGLGTSAARLGVTTGVVAAKAGSSVGRFFRHGGVALAKSFQATPGR